jgi:hypothetical protein
MNKLASLCSLSLLISTACASHEGQAEGPKPVGDPKPSTVTVSVASAQLIQDCADPPEPTRAEPGATLRKAKPMPTQERAAPVDDIAPGAAAIAGDGPGFHQPCTQSTVQLKLDNDGDTAAKVSVRAVRLLAPGSMRLLGTMTARKPSLWDASGTYQPWDQSIAARSEVAASYRLSLPDWAEVERELGGSSMGKMFVIEVEVEVDGDVQTVRSPELPREEPHVIVT